uniref:Uncharacterized protein n=1 Tax=Dulem virus 38 TaxID=3145756 RepID=A0AAU8B0B5_9CAUD
MDQAEPLTVCSWRWGVLSTPYEVSPTHRCIL